jgi:hypothetical protein
VKIKYKIYPLPGGLWRATWDLDGKQYHAAMNLAWCGSTQPESVSIRRKYRGTDRERRKLEMKCKAYADDLCAEIERERETDRLMKEAPVIEHGCDS